MQFIGSGEVIREEEAIGYARSLFLKVLEKYASEALEDLQVNVLGYYTQLPGEVKAQFGYFWEEDHSAIQDLKAALVNWASKYNLIDAWCIESALDALVWYNLSPEDYDSDYWEGSDWTGCPISRSRSLDIENNIDSSGVFTFEHLHLGLRWQTKEQIKDELREAFESEMKSYINKLEEVATNSGYKPTPKKHDDTHFQWLVYFQVKGWSYKEIREHCGQHVGTDKAVEKAIKETAALIGLTLRII